jgi:hypothetical protein
MSLLTIIQGACDELNIVRPSAVYSSSDTHVRQLLQIAQMEGKEQARRFDWQILQKEGTFTTLAAETQVAVVTTTFADFGRICNNSMWNRTQSRPVRGPLTDQQWQMRKAAAAQVGVEYWWRIRGGALMFNPVPNAGDSIYFEYISNKWCQSAALSAQVAWAADTDLGIVDEEIIRLGIVWRWKKSKGLEYAEEFRTYELALEDVFGPDAGKSTVDMTGEPAEWGVNLPDGNWSLS